ncbi:MAG: TolC family protein [Thermodesulfobacteriota bacterium]
MIKTGSVVLCLLFLLHPVALLASPAALEPPEVWTARNSVTFALANSPDSQVARQRMEMAGAAVQEARVGYFPNVDLSAQYGQTNNPMYSFGNILNQGSFTPSIDFNDPGRTDDFNLRAGVEYRFYNGGRDQAGIEAAEAGLARSETDRDTVRCRLAYEVVRSFQFIIQATEQLEARKVSLAAIQASLKVAKARFDAGDLLKEDLLNLEVQESRASENLILAEHGLELSQKVFLNLLGLKEGPVEIDPIQETGQQLPRERSYEQRSELQSLAHAEEAAQARLEAARGGNLPTVDGFASYQYDKGFVMDGDGDSWMAGVKVNYRLFDGHRTSATIARAMAELATIRAQRQKMELGMDLEVKQADLSYRQAEQRLQVTEKMVEQARESARLSRTRFKEGVILSSDLIDVEMRLTDALVRQSVARANIKVAVADLRRAMGVKMFCEMTEGEGTE